MSARDIAVLGLGAMGSRMASRLLAAGHQVVVWNRSPDRAQPLLEAGARWAASPREAAAQADFVIAMVRDDAASSQVWCDPVHGALPAMRPGAVAIESSTLSLAAVQDLAHQAARLGVAWLEAPVSGSRPAAEAGRLVYLVGGDPEVFERARPLLLALGAAAHHVGPVGSGARAKLVTNALLGVHVSALAELTAWLVGQGVAAEPIWRAVTQTPVWAPVDQALVGSMLAADFSPQFPIDLMAKDVAYTLGGARDPQDLPLLAAVAGVLTQARLQGLGELNMTAVARLYSPASAA